MKEWDPKNPTKVVVFTIDPDGLKPPKDPNYIQNQINCYHFINHL